MLHFVKLWKEMHGARLSDIAKVILCLKENVRDELKKYPAKIEEFQKSLGERRHSKLVMGRIPTASLPNHILNRPGNKNIGTKKRTRNDSVFYEDPEIPKINKFESPLTSKEMSEIRKKVLDMIEEQRLTCMVQGQSFKKPSKTSNRDGGGFVFCKLSNNHKYLYYRDMSECDDGKNYSVFDIKDMIVVKNIKNVTTLEEKLQDIITEDTENPLIHIHRILEIHEGQFELNITYEHDSLTFPKEQSSLALIATDKKSYDVWSDGINILREQNMKSDRFEEEFKALEAIELRMTYLEIDKTTPMKSLPKVPPPPSNYNFSKNYDFIGRPNVQRKSNRN